MSPLAESIAVLRALTEAKGVRVGDYVTSADGTGGFVDMVRNGRVSYQWSDHGDTKRVWIDADKVTVNPGAL